MDYAIEVEAEEDIYSFTSADNGAGPLWSHGSTIVARWRDKVYVVALETLADQPPTNNCRWVLYCRDEKGWKRVYADESGRTREPSPVVLLDDGQLLVSANPTLAEEGEYGGPAQPTVFRFDAKDAAVGSTVELPVWQGEPAFSEHSYRTVVADAPAGQVLYMQNVSYDSAHMSLRDRGGNWRGIGQIYWPRGDEYEKPQPLRLCYPNVVLHAGQAHFLGVADIVEPVAAWQQEKFEQSGRKWDYVFRRLFYAYSPNIESEPFGKWVELANLDATAGQISSGDIHLGADGQVHLLWSQTNADARLRERFFPEIEIEHALYYSQLLNGVEQRRVVLAQAGEGADLIPQLARFHQTPSGKLLVLASFAGEGGHKLRLATLDDEDMAWRDVPLERPFAATFLTATRRAGSAPSEVIDLVGFVAGQGQTLSYARIRVE